MNGDAWQLGNLYEPHRRVASLMTSTTNVLDVGCGFGDFGELATACGARLVDGIEPDPERRRTALDRLHYVAEGPLVGDFEDEGLLDEYDIVTFFDVVEHLSDPGPALEWAGRRLADGGRLFLLIPNSAHWSFRKKMLKGDWSYTDWGLFDRTHLRFYDPDTMSSLPRPESMAETQRRYYGNSTRAGRALVAARPRLFALHVLIEWRHR